MMLRRPRFAVALAAYNGMLWIDDQLSSILEQRSVDVDVFISVDISSDETYEHVLSLASKNSRICVLPQIERFGGAAKNFYRLIRDIDISGFDYLALADQDDIWLENKLIRAHQVLIERQAEVYSGNVMAFWEDGRQRLLDKAQPMRAYDYLFEAAGPGCSYVMGRAFAQRLQAFMEENWSAVNEVALHDWLIYAYGRSSEAQWYIDPWPSVLYRQHGGNVVGANVGVRSALSRIRRIKGGWYRDESRKIIRCLGLEDTPGIAHIILKKERLSAIRLLVEVNKTRRKLTDRIALALFILLGLYR
ncbi:glycosyltransferase [Pseudomonas luteola]|uniref:glycosyltransferase n=1 Tax=Pseudomonas luteola TaxID=47886 RepID=UPI0015E2EC69|nr:glycosyltransferase [Pseudomonas zeshuii]MBA1247930.1 glycosyltransferase [Pseudomonas zeshuii]